MACGSKLIRTRFAPSPTGPLHLGHAYAAIFAAERAREAGGEFLLRIEDLDQTRARPEYEAAVHEDMRWLGLAYPRPVLRQSERAAEYEAALAELIGLGVCYPCRCRRRDIQAALSAPQEGAPIHGPDGLVYPGTCRGRHMDDAAADDVVRLDCRAAFRVLGGGALAFCETSALSQALTPMSEDAFAAQIGDVVLARRDTGSSYHLAVCVDDAAQGVTLVTRGEDLFAATWIHVLLQRLLGLPTPAYHHHRLVRDEAGKRLAKRDDARALSLYRAQGATPDDIRRMIGL